MPKKIENPTPQQLAHRNYNNDWWKRNKDKELKKRRDITAAKRAAQGLQPFVKNKKNENESTKKTAAKKANKNKVATKKKPVKKKPTKKQIREKHKIQKSNWRQKVSKQKAAQKEIERQKRIDEYNKQFK